ncbi:hypothetical protein R3P38DRAFT_2920828 [Favolaschia claudopus]|uniref:Uncharacterized protein n=1 Tax=Favolaschia claudopus TaxID=2862362 RepID=A0AAW0C1L5_9AGAR
MLQRPRPAGSLRSLNPLRVRGIASYSPKVRAFPFKVSPSDAISQLSISSAAGLDPLSRLFVYAGIFPPTQPQRIVPVYFPAWFIDGEVTTQATFSFPDTRPKDGHITSIFLNSYFPGHDMDKISSVSLLSDTLAKSEALPFTPELETQWDTKITCIPFKTTPFSVLDAFQSLHSDQCRPSEHVSFDPSTISIDLFCAYPILIPLYLVQYADETTVVLEAHHESGRIFVERGSDDEMHQFMDQRDDAMDDTVNRLRRQLRDLPGRPSNDGIRRMTQFLDRQSQKIESQIDALAKLVSGPFRYARGSPTPFANIAALTIPPTWTRWNFVHFRDFKRWVDGFQPETLPVARANEMDDPRVRPFTADEVLAVRKFLLAGQERAKAHTLLDSISKIKATGASQDKLKEYVDSVDASREKSTPQWWKEWQKTTQPK